MFVGIVVDRHVRPAMVPGIGDHIAFQPEVADDDRAGDRALVDRAEFYAVELLRLADAQRVDGRPVAHALRTVSAIHLRTTPSAPAPS